MSCVAVLTIPPRIDAPYLARRFVWEQLNEWAVAEPAYAAVLLTSEAVACTLRDSRTTVVTVVATANAVEISVDTDDRREWSEDGGAGAEDHGLQLLDDLADEWGVRHVDGRAQLWFRLARRRDTGPEPTALATPR